MRTWGWGGTAAAKRAYDAHERALDDLGLSGASTERLAVIKAIRAAARPTALPTFIGVLREWNYPGPMIGRESAEARENTAACILLLATPDLPPATSGPYLSLVERPFRGPPMVR